MSTAGVRGSARICTRLASDSSRSTTRDLADDRAPAPPRTLPSSHDTRLAPARRPRRIPRPSPSGASDPRLKIAARIAARISDAPDERAGRRSTAQRHAVEREPAARCWLPCGTALRANGLQPRRTRRVVVTMTAGAPPAIRRANALEGRRDSDTDGERPGRLELNHALAYTPTGAIPGASL